MQERLLRIIDSFAGRTIAVIGDLIADEFLYGEIARVSREAPVLVLHHDELVTLPGGAANAASNIADLSAIPRVIGCVGKDPAGRALVQAMRDRKADMRHLRLSSAATTPVKTRILARAHHSAPQQVVRIDRPGSMDGPAFTRASWSPSALLGCHGIILSDYDYGTVTPAVVTAAREFSKKKRVPLVADSRFRMAEFHDITSITPNITELEASLGRTIGNDQKLLDRVGDEFLRRQRLECLLVTQGRFGMTLLQPHRRALHIPIFGTDDVADVTGAGDTVTAVFTLALACGGSPADAARLANYAGGIVVMKRGTATVSREELRSAVIHDLSR